jgi:serine/threonine-protein kinase
VDETQVGADPIDLTLTSIPGGSLAGTTLGGRYRLIRLIGAGGMAQVWEGTDEVLNRNVAIKVLHPHLANDESLVRRFRQEAIAAARLNDPGIVGVYDTCSDGGHEAIVMELLQATTLRALIDERGTIDSDTTTRIGLRLLDALEAAHRAGLVHRDVKPSNILLCDDGRVKIADFGIAKADDHTELTREGSLLGTASYLAPEQLTGVAVDGRADLYALGLVLYECLTGRVPFDGDTGAAVALARLHTAPVDPRRIRSDIPPRLAAALMRALERDPDERFSSAADFRAALLQTDLDIPAPSVAPPLEEPTTAVTPEVPSFGRSERRWLLPAFVILLIAVAVIVAGLLFRESRASLSSTTTSTTEAPATPSPLTVTSIVSYDPQGSGAAGENDSMADRAVDGNDRTAWRTETYDQPNFFGGKTGVGLVLELEQRSVLDSLRISGSPNGWSAKIYVLDAPPGPDGVDGLTPAGSVDGVKGHVSVDLSRAEGSVVLLWITNLGTPVDGTGHRVEIQELVPVGHPADG